MSKDCCSHEVGHNHDITLDPNDKTFKKILWIALILNLGMFFLEVIFGLLSQSLSLRADAIDFLGDGLNYFATLFILNSAIQTKAKLSITKAIFMLVFGLWVLGEAVYRFFGEQVPDAFTMSWVGILALLVNATVALLLFKFKEGDSNMRSVWLCSRNDALGNLAVVLASGGVYWWGRQWPDLIVALFMAGLALSAAFQILRIAKTELKTGMKIVGASGHDHHNH